MKRPRILIIENSIHVTGALKSITRSSYDLKEYFDFVFVLPRHSAGRQLVESSGFSVIYELPMLELNRTLFALLFYIPILLANTFRLKRIIKQEKIQMLHVNDLYNLLPVVLKITGLRLPYICHIRFLPDKFPKKLFSFWLVAHLRYAQHVICVSNFLKDKLPYHAKIVVINNELPMEEKYPYPADRSTTLLYLSNIIRGKGHEFGIKAFSRIASSFPTWKLRFVGGDMGLSKNKELKRELMELCQWMGISHQVEWIDFTIDTEAEYKNAAIALNFSESESFSITCVEAQFYGCPLIATDSGGPAEIIIDSQTGFLIPIGNINSMVSSMQTLINDSLLRLKFAERGREVVRDRFSIANTSYRLKRIYSDTLT